MKPTTEQIKWFWEQCGLEYQDGYFSDVIGNQILASRHILTLDNLFKYAVPNVAHLESIEFWQFSGVTLRIHETAYSENKSYTAMDKDPALALFWAIYKALGEKE